MKRVKLTDEERNPRTRAKRWRAANREKVMAVNAAWRAANPDKAKACSASWRAANHVKERARVSSWRQANHGRHKANSAVWALTHPEKRKASGDKRRAVQMGATIGDTRAIAAWRDRWRKVATVSCRWCNKHIAPRTAHMDHIVPLIKGGAHSLENLCISCAKCNLTKKDKLPEVWEALLAKRLLAIA